MVSLPPLSSVLPALVLSCRLRGLSDLTRTPAGVWTSPCFMLPAARVGGDRECPGDRRSLQFGFPRAPGRARPGLIAGRPPVWRAGPRGAQQPFPRGRETRRAARGPAEGPPGAQARAVPAGAPSLRATQSEEAPETPTAALHLPASSFPRLSLKSLFCFALFEDMLSICTQAVVYFTFLSI